MPEDVSGVRWGYQVRRDLCAVENGALYKIQRKVSEFDRQRVVRSGSTGMEDPAVHHDVR